MSAKQKKPKPGKVVRLSPSVWSFVSSQREKDETISDTFKRLLFSEVTKEKKDGKVYFICPTLQLIFSDCKDLAEARGQVILVKKKLLEDPIPVIEVTE